jgi:type II secretion system protein D
MTHHQKQNLSKPLPKHRWRPSQLLCAVLIAALLFWRSPSTVTGQTAQKEPESKDPAEKPKAQPTAASPPPKPNTNASPATAEAESATKTPGPTVASEPTSGSGSDTNSVAAKKDADGKAKDDNEILLSFQGANVDMVVQWLASTTGKSVLKHPRVQCQLTIVSSKKIPKREAVTLVYRALGLEGFTAIESSKAILIVPEGSEPKMSPEWLSASRTDVPEGRQKLVKVFPLQHVQAVEVKDKVKGLLSEKATVDTDERANQIIITDYNENIALAGQLINVLDSDKPQDVAVRVIPLKNVSAQDLVKEIAPLYTKMSGKSPNKELIEVAANDRSNSLIVLASEANFKSIEAVVAMLDTEDAQEKIMRAFVLKNAEAQDVAKQLQDLYQDSDASSRYPWYYNSSSSNQSKNNKKMSVVSDRRRNTVIVQAAPAAMEGLAKMIETLDEPVGDEGLAPRIYPLKYVSAGDIVEILNELFLKKTPARTYWYYDEPPPSNVDRDVGKLYGKVRITSEPHSNALILTSNSAENLAAVEAVVKQLDVPSEAGDTTLRVGLNFAKAATVANSINILFAKNGSPALRPITPQQQPQNQTYLQQQLNQNTPSQSNFELEQDIKEEGYFPWLGGAPDNPRPTEGQNARPVSDLVGRVRVVSDQRSNSLLISANVHFFPQVLKLIEEMDAPTAQVLIEARIVEVASDYLDKLGVRWSPDGSKVFTADDFDNSILIRSKGEVVRGFGDAVGGLGGPAAALANSLHSGVIDSTFNLDFLIQFLRKTTDATVLAAPQINIADNEMGKLFVGQQVPILNNQVNPALGGNSVSYSYKDVGVILQVTPHINTKGEVALRISTESSSVVPGVTVFGGNVFDTRNFKTDLTVKNSETVVLGGIIQKQISDTLRKTPFLGDIPWLGWAFKKKDKTTHEVELMVFLHPKVVRTPKEAKELMDQVDRNAPHVKQWQEESGPPK